MRLALRDALPVEVGHLLDQVVVLQQDRAVRADGQRVIVTRDRGTAVVRGPVGLGGGHRRTIPFSWWGK
jgi:lipopolysaccharide export system protein LptA